MPELAFFTRVLDDAPAPERYRLAIEQIQAAERLGYDSAWVAQHHFNGNEGGLPAPLVLLASAAAQTSTIRLGTGIITLGMENAVRVAEDAAVLDALSGERIELGFGSGGTPTSFPAFGLDFEERHRAFDENFETLRHALRGERFGASDNLLYPPAPSLADRLWFATFSAPLAVRAGHAGLGLQLSRSQPRPADNPDATLSELQHPIVDAYEAALPAGAPRRVSIARSVFISDDHEAARELAERRYRVAPLARYQLGDEVDTLGRDDLLRKLDVHVGDVESVAASLAADSVLQRATQLSFQVHSVDPEHALILRSLELLITEVAPRLGWR
ncbi:putative FMN-dependent luciferase-like monooxygenase [Mycetocola tolaasinivorans]|uniref:Putative FMN-dependent luciferase-like monooxygenase n=1 Tax=Mycetocola tolaasinivorans TaxID=76635 RepID=A0A3L7A495_9MICO|nr:putative FMN-dependent luciferase-like monooxygenase [Mycetocola tolaasinivorans]RLP75027.1 putative FMN-dependent luciferase-like monooxygenase [Mycetocola tolaasinivorans]